MPKLKLSKYYRVVVTGDRNWPAEGYYTIKERFLLLPKNTLIITGDARGVDEQADIAAAILHFKCKILKAEWNKYGRNAGPIRNLRFFEEFKPHLCLAFHNNLSKSRGTKSTIQLSRQHSVPVEHIVMTMKGN